MSISKIWGIMLALILSFTLSVSLQSCKGNKDIKTEVIQPGEKSSDLAQATGIDSATEVDVAEPVGSPDPDKSDKQLITEVLVAGLGLYELIVRLIKTGRNFSLIDIAFALISFLLPNKKAGGGFHWPWQSSK